jgi:hypothetical protein
MADPGIDELKELMRQNIALAQDTNRVLHSMRTTSRLKSLFWVVIFLVSTGASVYAYYYFLGPRVEQIKKIYQTDIAPLQGASSDILNFFKGGSATNTKTQ